MPRDAAFDHAVDAVVDHHDDEKKYPAACDAVVVPTGSCATLVAEALVSPVDASSLRIRDGGAFVSKKKPARKPARVVCASAIPARRFCWPPSCWTRRT